MGKLNLTSTSFMIMSNNGETDERGVSIDINARESLSEVCNVYNGEYKLCKDRLANIGTEKDNIINKIKTEDKKIEELNKQKSELENKYKDIEHEIKECEEEIERLESLDTTNIDYQIKQNEKDRTDKLKIASLNFERAKHSIEANKQIKLNEAETAFRTSPQGNISQDDYVAITRPNNLQSAAMRNIDGRYRAKDILTTNINDKTQSFHYDNAQIESSIANLNTSIDNVKDHYEPIICEYQEDVNSIYDKYQGTIDNYNEKIDESIRSQENDLNDLKLQLDTEVKAANNQISNINNDIKKTKKDFDRQIRDAEAQGNATTRLKQSKNSKISKLEADITKIKNNFEKAKAKVEVQIQSVNSQYAKEQKRLEELRDAVISKRDNELAKPNQLLKDAQSRRDSEINNLNNEIAVHKSTLARLKSDYEQYVANEENTYNNTIYELDNAIRNYADTCELEVDPSIDNSTVAFKELGNKVENWNSIINNLCKNGDKLDTLKEKKKQELINKNYPDLIECVDKAKNLPEKANILASSKLVIMIIGVVMSLASIAVFLLADIVASIIPLIVGLVLAVLPNIVYSKTLNNYVQALSLATDFREFNGIIEHSNETILNEKIRILLELGEKLVSIKKSYFDRQNEYSKEINIINSNASSDISKAESDYHTKVLEINTNYEKLMKTLKKALKDFKAGNENSLVEANQKLSDLNKNKDNTEVAIQNNKSARELLESSKKKYEEKLVEAEKFEKEAPIKIANFRHNVEDLMKALTSKCIRGNDTALVKDTNSELYNSIFLGIDNADTKDNHNVMNIKEFKHNKKPIIVVYDEVVEKETGKTVAESVNTQLNNVVNDMALSFRLLNSKSSLRQYIIDLPICADDLASSAAKQAYGIEHYTNSLDGMKEHLEVIKDTRSKLVSNGVESIDKLNAKKYEDGAEPEKYNIVYFIMRVDEDITKPLDNVVLINCDRYGFLPIFVISKKMWQGTKEGRSDFVNNLIDNNTNPVIMYTNKEYQIMSEEESLNK